jgi:hypothetical protein
LYKYDDHQEKQLRLIDSAHIEKGKAEYDTLYRSRLQLWNSCAIHLSSQTDSTGATILLFNNHPYRIATRPDGSLVLRKAK